MCVCLGMRICVTVSEGVYVCVQVSGCRCEGIKMYVWGEYAHRCTSVTMCECVVSILLSGVDTLTQTACLGRF